MAGLVDAGENLALDGLAAGVSWISLHTADPSTGGTDEVSGGTYTREAITWATGAQARAARSTAHGSADAS